jgi:two-component sensor histidine kinase
MAILGGTGIALLSERRYAEDNAASETESITRLITSQARESLDHVQRVIEQAELLLARLKSNAVSPEEVSQRLNDLVQANPAVGTIWAVREDGSSWVDNFSASPRSGSVTHRHYFQVHRAGAQSFVGPVEIGTLSRRPRLTVSTRLDDANGEFAGVLVAGVDASHFLSLFTAAGYAPGLSASLLSKNGETLIAAGTTAPGVRTISTSRELDPPGITLVVSRDMTLVLADWRRRAWMIGLSVVAICLGFVGLTYMGVRTAAQEEQARAELKSLAAGLEQRVAEGRTEVEMMLVELKHRVKNNLAVVMALLSHQARASTAAEVKEALQTAAGRVDIIASLYDSLDQRPGAILSTKALVSRVAENVDKAMRKPGKPIRLALDLQDVELIADKAVSLGLFVNEALTNAFKHCKTSVPEATITVTLTSLEHGFELTVSNPCTADGPKAESGHGSKLLEGLSRQLNGQLSVTAGEEFRIALLVERETAEPVEAIAEKTMSQG